MKETVRTWLESGRIDVFLGYMEVNGHPLPHAFGPGNLAELDALAVSEVRYPLEKAAVRLVAENPDVKIGMMARDCTHRSLNVQYAWNRLKPENIVPLPVNCCPSPLGKKPRCSYMKAEEAGPIKKRIGIDNGLTPQDLEKLDGKDRFARWMYEFQKCIKCYGCRDICPVCTCTDCSLEHDDLVGNGRLPPDAPIFHLVRAVHMAGICVDCGLCEEACPAGIPLRLLYRKVNEIVGSLFDYQAGAGTDRPPFSVLGHGVTLGTKPLIVSEKEE